MDEYIPLSYLLSEDSSSVPGFIIFNENDLPNLSDFGIEEDESA